MIISEMERIVVDACNVIIDDKDTLWGGGGRRADNLT
jgi:hypothetical protein